MHDGAFRTSEEKLRLAYPFT